MIDKLVVIEIIAELELPEEEKKIIIEKREIHNKTWEKINQYDDAYGSRKRKLPGAE